MNLANNLETSASFFPDRTAVCENDLKMTYAQFNDQANRVATGLIKMGIKAGDHVGSVPRIRQNGSSSILVYSRQVLLQLPSHLC